MQKNDDYKFALSLGLLDMDPTVLSFSQYFQTYDLVNTYH